MKNKQAVTILVMLIIVLSGITTATGIFSDKGDGSYMHETIRGEQVEIWGRGVYRDMSAEVAPQGIAQDYVTLIIGIPLLIIGLAGYRKGSHKAHFLLSGTLGYFFVTFLFYTAMGMYNKLFLLYAALLGLSFWGLLLALLDFPLSGMSATFAHKAPARFTGGFLVFNSVAIALMWLSQVVPPLLNGSIYPDGLHHYTTLIVQGFDLGLLLPISFVAGLLLYRKKDWGFLSGTTYIIFLAILMTALTAKVIAIYITGGNVIPAIFIIPAFNLITIICAVLMIKNDKRTR